MFFYLDDDRFKYELEKLSRLFLPFEKFSFTDTTEELSGCDEFICVECGKPLAVELKLDGKPKNGRSTCRIPLTLPRKNAHWHLCCSTAFIM